MSLYHVRSFNLAKNPVVVRIRRWLSKLRHRRSSHATREVWETLYLSGRWDYLRQIRELARYAMIMGYCLHLKRTPTILDIGCGEGILQEWLSPWYLRYVGIDIADEAIRRVAPKQDERTVFVRADASTYIPDEQFDIIIFNECLYYFEDPLNTIRRYERFIKDDAIFIVSMYVLEKNLHIWKTLETVYTVMDEVQVSHKSGISWIINVFMPSRDQN